MIMKDKLTRADIKWTLRHLLTLRIGDWPDPEWNETASFGNKAPAFQAKFIGPCELAGEVERRLNACGLDGFLVKQCYAWGETVNYLSIVLNLSPSEINRGIAETMAYISGKWPKQTGYKAYKSHRREEK